MKKLNPVNLMGGSLVFVVNLVLLCLPIVVAAVIIVVVVVVKLDLFLRCLFRYQWWCTLLLFLKVLFSSSPSPPMMMMTMMIPTIIMLKIIPTKFSLISMMIHLRGKISSLIKNASISLGLLISLLLLSSSSSSVLNYRRKSNSKWRNLIDLNVRRICL